jgi:uncharacterized protein
MFRSTKYLEAMKAYDSNQEELALRLLKECAEAEDPAACFTLALWYREGDDVTKNLDQSARWLARQEEIAEQGNLEAQWDVGQNYRFGNLAPLDVQKANLWLERAAEGGYGEAQHHLAWYLQTGQYGYPINMDLSSDWYKRAFDQGHPETLYSVAITLFNSSSESKEEALKLLKLASDKGFQQASHTLELLSQNGL